MLQECNVGIACDMDGQHVDAKNKGVIRAHIGVFYI